MFRLLITYLLLSLGLTLSSQDQEFECDGAAYIIVYTQSTGVSTLYRVEEKNRNFNYTPIELSEDRRLTCLSYNVLDKHLYVLDVDTYELLRIDRNGVLTSFGVPANLDQEFIYNAGTISPDGAGIYMIGYNPEFGFDNKFYTINLSRDDLYAGFLGVTGEARAEIHDFATDPLSGEMYGYDNLEGSLAQIGIGGQISSAGFPNNGVSIMDGIFFNREGDLFGYAASRGFYAINKRNGKLEFLESGPEGTSGDACSCPYTSSFEKDVHPREILPCQEFEIVYSFNNKLGIGQTWVSLRDTMPEGFEILEIKSKIVTSVNVVESPPHILALDNLIYLMRDNEIVVTVRAPSDYIGPFESSATHWDFPKAFGTIQISDDQTTVEIDDPTVAMIIGEEDLDFNDFIEYSCDGKEVTITSPIKAEAYLWSDGSQDDHLTTSESGWYTLLTQNDCVVYHDSVFISDFLDEKELVILGLERVNIGATVILSSTVNRGIPIIYKWYDGRDTISCLDCASMIFTPIEDTNFELYIIDEQGCRTDASFRVIVDLERDFYAATAFSPNGDGINDLFFLQSSTQGTIKNMSVYNRWGGEVFSANDAQLNEPANGWDGSFHNGKTIDTGVYIWVAEIEYIDGLTESKSGSVTLMAHN